jgi:hypothetical protein
LQRYQAPDAITHHGGVELGDYFSSCIDHYRKDVFWETPAFRFDPEQLKRLEWNDVEIHHMSSVHVLKRYWYEPGWYTWTGCQEAKLVQQRLLTLEREFGMQQLGTGRSGTTQNALVKAVKIIMASPSYVKFFA